MKFLDSTHVSARGKPLDPKSIPSPWPTLLPEYCLILTRANGIEIRGGLFRVFGLGDQCLGRDIAAWNRGAWKGAYGVDTDYVFWAENIFGDQYGLHEPSARLVTLNCEGGEIEQLPFRSITEFLESLVLRDDLLGLEVDLVRGAEQQGLKPSLTDHLSFELPLICGGEPDSANLEVLDGEAHLELLGQIIEQTKDVPEGAPIRKFED